MAYVSLAVKQLTSLHCQACLSAPCIPEAFELASQACQHMVLRCTTKQCMMTAGAARLPLQHGY